MKSLKMPDLHFEFEGNDFHVTVNACLGYCLEADREILDGYSNATDRRQEGRR